MGIRGAGARMKCLTQEGPKGWPRLAPPPCPLNFVCAVVLLRPILGKTSQSGPNSTGSRTSSNLVRMPLQQYLAWQGIWHSMTHVTPEPSENGDGRSIERELKRGSLELIVLHLLSSGE